MHRVTTAAFESTLDGMSVPIVLVDGRCGIVHANVSARALLAQGDPLALEGDVLRACVASAARTLTAAIARTAQPEALMGKIGIDVPVPMRMAAPASRMCWPLGPGAVRGGFGARAAAAVFFTLPEAPQRPPAAAWAAAFAFTPSEMRLLDLLVQGHTLNEAAGLLGIAKATARTHVIRLMAKAGVTRQADLIRLALRLSPPVRDGEG